MDLRHLVAAFVDHFVVADHEAVLDGEVVKFRARVGVRDGNLDGFDVEFLGKVDRTTNRLVCFAGEAEDEVSVNRQAQLMAVFCKLFGTLDGGALLDVFENLRIENRWSRARCKTKSNPEA